MISAWGYILKTFIRTSVFFTGRLTLSQSSPPVRNATYLRTLFFKIYLCFARDFVNQHVFLLLDLHWDSPKLPWGMQRIFVPFVLKTVIMPFKRFFVLWHSLIRSLYVIQVYMNFFILLIHSAPFFRFSYILLYTNFFLCILLREIFFLIPDDAFARNFIIFNFSSQRPHLN